MKNPFSKFFVRIHVLAMIISLTTGLFTQAFAKRGGGIDSGGGGAFLCQNVYTIEEPGAAPTYVEGKSYLLDLWEAQFLRGWKVVRTQENEFTQLRKAFEKLRSFDSSLPDYLYNLAVKLNAEKKPLDNGVELEPPRDAASNYKMKNCRLVGMMFYDEELGRVMHDADIYSLLASKTDVAAAMAHEAWYYFVRRQAPEYRMSPYFAENSKKSRRLIGCLFSTDTDCLSLTEEEKRIDQKAKELDSTYRCVGTTSHITLVPKPSPEVGFDLIMHNFADRKFSNGLFGGAYFTDNFQFSLVPGRLASYDLAKLLDMPHIFIQQKEMTLKEPWQIILLKEKPHGLSGRYQTRNDSTGSLVPIYEAGDYIDTLTCKKVQ